MGNIYGTNGCCFSKRELEKMEKKGGSVRRSCSHKRGTKVLFVKGKCQAPCRRRDEAGRQKGKDKKKEEKINSKKRK